jgi:hypothetical protein
VESSAAEDAIAKLNGWDETLDSVIGLPTATVNPFAGLRKFSTTASCALASEPQMSDSDGGPTVYARAELATMVAAMTITTPVTPNASHLSHRISESYTSAGKSLAVQPATL